MVGRLRNAVPYQIRDRTVSPPDTTPIPVCGWLNKGTEPMLPVFFKEGENVSGAIALAL